MSDPNTTTPPAPAAGSEFPAGSRWITYDGTVIVVDACYRVPSGRRIDYHCPGGGGGHMGENHVCRLRPAPSASAPGSENSEWPARDIVRKLIEAADLLLDHCDYDGHGWEEIHLARTIAHSWAESPNTQPSGGRT